MVEVSAWKIAQSRQARSEIPTEESMEEKEPELNITPDQELQEHEEEQSHQSGDTELLPD